MENTKLSSILGKGAKLGFNALKTTAQVTQTWVKDGGLTKVRDTMDVAAGTVVVKGYNLVTEKVIPNFKAGMAQGKEWAENLKTKDSEPTESEELFTLMMRLRIAGNDVEVQKILATLTPDQLVTWEALLKLAPKA